MDVVADVMKEKKQEEILSVCRKDVAGEVMWS